MVCFILPTCVAGNGGNNAADKERVCTLLTRSTLLYEIPFGRFKIPAPSAVVVITPLQVPVTEKVNEPARLSV